MAWLLFLMACGGDPGAPEAVLPALGCDAAAGDPALEYAYVVDTEGDSVTVLNPRACSVAKTVPVAEHPVVANASASGAWVFVGSAGAAPTLTLIHTDAHDVRKTLPLPFAPDDMRFDADHVNLWITDRASGRIAVFDTIAQEMLGEIAVEPGMDIVSMTDGPVDWMVVSNPDGGFLQVMDPHRLEEHARVELGGRPTAIDFARPSDASFVCVDGPEPALLVVPTDGPLAHTVTERIALPAPCTDLRFDGGAYGVAVMPDADQVAIIDTATRQVTALVDVGDAPDTVMVASDRAAVGNRGSGDVSVLDLSTGRELGRPVVTLEAAGTAERQLRDAMDDHFVYVVTPEDDTVTVIDLRDGTARGRAETGALPGAVIVAGKAGGSCC